jgi:hypothetical protein
MKYGETAGVIGKKILRERKRGVGWGGERKKRSRQA